MPRVRQRIVFRRLSRFYLKHVKTLSDAYTTGTSCSHTHLLEPIFLKGNAARVEVNHTALVLLNLTTCKHEASVSRALTATASLLMGRRGRPRTAVNTPTVLQGGDAREPIGPPSALLPSAAAFAERVEAALDKATAELDRIKQEWANATPEQDARLKERCRCV